MYLTSKITTGIVLTIFQNMVFSNTDLPVLLNVKVLLYKQNFQYFFKKHKSAN